MFSFGATVFLVFALHELETAQPKNIFFGHLVSVLVGIIFNETIGFSFLFSWFSSWSSCDFNDLFKNNASTCSIKPFGSFIYRCIFRILLFPVIFGTLAIIIMSIFINRIVLKRKYPKNKNWLY